MSFWPESAAFKKRFFILNTPSIYVFSGLNVIKCIRDYILRLKELVWIDLFRLFMHFVQSSNYFFF